VRFQQSHWLKQYYPNNHKIDAAQKEDIHRSLGLLLNVLERFCMQIMKKAPTSPDVSASFSALPLLFKDAARL
jgi:hypothetical protein